MLLPSFCPWIGLIEYVRFYSHVGLIKSHVRGGVTVYVDCPPSFHQFNLLVLLVGSWNLTDMSSQPNNLGISEPSCVKNIAIPFTWIQICTYVCRMKEKTQTKLTIRAYKVESISTKLHPGGQEKALFLLCYHQPQLPM
jgi:hypothetical protein